MSRTQGNIILVDNFMKIEYTIGVRKVRNALLLKGGLYMELAKVTTKGQVTIPKSIRELLGLKEGSKILFIQKGNDIVIQNSAIYMLNSSMDALREAQRAFAGEAERLGLHDDNDVMEMIKEIREESVVK